MRSPAGVGLREDLPDAKNARITQLDGLRGLAALIVVVHHALLVSPALADAYGQAGRAGLTGAAWWLTHTPLHLLWDGTSAVFLFFVLSGFAVSLPFLGARPPRWRDYYPRRLARLYVPVWGAVGFAVLMAVLVPRVARPDQSWWINAHAIEVNASAIAHDATLLFGTTWLNSPVWSLRWEVWFSLALPLYLWVTVRAKKVWWLWLGVMAVMILLRPNEYAFYLSMFGIGVVMAVHRNHLAGLTSNLPRWAWPGLAVLALLLTNASWYWMDVPAELLLTLVGTSLLVFIFLGWPTAKRLGDARPVQWLGKRSFSLYLVHEPIVVSLAMLLPAQNALIALAVSLPLSLLAAATFYRLVEHPAHRFARGIANPREQREPLSTR